MATRKKRRVKKADAGQITLRQVEDMIGSKYHLLDEDYDDMAFEVLVQDVLVESCGIKALVIPVAGKGERYVCLSELLTEEQLDAKLEGDTVTELIDNEIREITRHYYCRERRAAFIEFVESYLDKEELEKLTEEAGGSLKKVGDHFIRTQATRLVNRKHGREVSSSY